MKDEAGRMFTRREFVTVGLMAAGAVATSGCAPDKAQSAVATPSSSYGRDTEMGKRVLVTYATGRGSTVGVAEKIGKTLGDRGFEVDVKPAKDRPPVEGYDALVMGSAVNGGKWLPEAADFARSIANRASAIPTALFCVHIMNTGDDEKSRERRLAYLDDIRPLVKPVDEAFFAGTAQLESQPWIARFIYRAFKIGPEGDARDWDAIRGWAEKVQVG